MSYVQLIRIMIQNAKKGYFSLVYHYLQVQNLSLSNLNPPTLKDVFCFKTLN